MICPISVSDLRSFGVVCYRGCRLTRSRCGVAGISKKGSSSGDPLFPDVKT